MRVLNRAQMQDADRRTIASGTPAAVLMDRAGHGVAAAILTAFPHRPFRRVTVIAGRGHNGGDGFVTARALADRGVAVNVVLLGTKATISGEPRAKLEALSGTGVCVIEAADAAAWRRVAPDALAADLIVDAMTGTGATGPLVGLPAEVAADVNRAAVSVVAVDLPSGLQGDRTDVTGPVVRATMTVTFGAPKLPLVSAPACELAGRLIVADIGIPDTLIAALAGPRVEVGSSEIWRTLIEPRRADSNKGLYGHVLIVGGSPGKTGAPCLSARAALRAGAGLATVATPRGCWPIVAASAMELMTEPVDETPDGSIAASAVDRVLAFRGDVIAIGPGLGRSTETTQFVHEVVARATLPMVIDADALNAFEGHADALVGRDAPIVITPHPGEMSRLTGRSIHDIQSNRLDVARDFAVSHHLHVVLKGHRTVIASPTGDVWINMSGNPGMATGGMGDVLTGVVATWLAQLENASDAATLAVHLHGRAADLAAAEIGGAGLLAGDVIERLPRAIRDPGDVDPIARQPMALAAR